MARAKLPNPLSTPLCVSALPAMPNNAIYSYWGLNSAYHSFTAALIKTPPLWLEPHICQEHLTYVKLLQFWFCRSRMPTYLPIQLRKDSMCRLFMPAFCAGSLCRLSVPALYAGFLCRLFMPAFNDGAPMRLSKSALLAPLNTLASHSTGSAGLMPATSMYQPFRWLKILGLPLPTLKRIPAGMLYRPHAALCRPEKEQRDLNPYQPNKLWFALPLSYVPTLIFSLFSVYFFSVFCCFSNFVELVLHSVKA